MAFDISFGILLSFLTFIYHTRQNYKSKWRENSKVYNIGLSHGKESLSKYIATRIYRIWLSDYFGNLNI